jgi:DNA mismatch repair protein MutL
MENKIAVLSREVANQIAAGEVVERPASILKELLENAIDAGSTDLSIELEQGGCKTIRVVDDGQGIDGSDIALAFQRHATSKIQMIDDIYHIMTYGFRGEALPSIASIARVEMISRKKNNLSGSRIVLDGGKVESIQEIGCPEGTSVKVTHIFDHVPARKKFLKSVAAEQAACMDVLIRIALSRPSIRLKVTSNGREILHVPHTAGLSERLPLVLGEDASGHMVPIEGQKGEIRLTGFITQPEYSRSNTKGYYFFVNGRFIKDALISHAVMTGYRRVIAEKRYPVLVFFIEAPPEDVDVNVHPAKTEIRFRNPREVYDCVVEAIISKLAVAHGGAQAWPTMEQKDAVDSYHHRVEEALKRYTLVTGGNRPTYGIREDRKPEPPLAELWHDPVVRVGEEISPDSPAPAAVHFSALDYLGQVGATYLVFSGGDKLVMMDQHAAHERILFEKIRLAARNRTDFHQALLVPEVLSLSPAEYEQFILLRELLADAGIVIEPFGGHSIVLKSIPGLLVNLSPKQFLPDLVSEVLDGGKSVSPMALKEKIFAVMACKGAVKANHTLSAEEVNALCVEMDEIPFNATCPHGRPVYLLYSLTELQKLFKRT